MAKIFDMVLFDNMSSYSPEEEENKLKVLSRDIKLTMLFKKDLFSISNQEDETLDFIVKNNLDKYIITGSFALKLYGLLDRECKDLDLITSEVDREYERVNTYPIEADNCRLGFSKVTEKMTFGNFLKRKSYNCDFFLNKDSKFKTFTYKGFELKIQEPLSIVEEKFKLIKSIKKDSNQYNWDSLGLYKHIRDIKNINMIINNHGVA